MSILSVNGMTIMFTGKLSKPRSVWKKIIEDQGGNVSESLSHKVHIMIASEKDRHREKVIKATHYKIPVHDEAWLCERTGQQQSIASDSAKSTSSDDDDDDNDNGNGNGNNDPADKEKDKENGKDVSITQPSTKKAKQTKRKAESSDSDGSDSKESTKKSKASKNEKNKDKDAAIQYPHLVEDVPYAIRGQQVTLSKNVYSCTCNAWRSKNELPHVRTCKHIKKLTGNAHLKDIGVVKNDGSVGSVRRSKIAKMAKPELMMAERIGGDSYDPAGWYMAESLGGVRCFWTGERLLSRLGDVFDAPGWFTHGFPTDTQLDGTLHMGRGRLTELRHLTRSANISEDVAEKWRAVRFHAFDVPSLREQPTETRLRALDKFTDGAAPYLIVAQYAVCKDLDQLIARVSDAKLQVQTDDRVVVCERDDDPEPPCVFLRQPGTYYTSRRSKSLVKVTPFQTCTAEVTEHVAGKAKYKNKTGAIMVRLCGPRAKDGHPIEAKVLLGMTDADHETPPRIGSFVSLLYQNITDGTFAVRYPVLCKQPQTQLDDPPLVRTYSNASSADKNDSIDPNWLWSIRNDERYRSLVIDYFFGGTLCKTFDSGMNESDKAAVMAARNELLTQHGPDFFVNREKVLTWFGQKAL